MCHGISLFLPCFLSILDMVLGSLTFLTFAPKWALLGTVIHSQTEQSLSLVTYVHLSSSDSFMSLHMVRKWSLPSSLFSGLGLCFAPISFGCKDLCEPLLLSLILTIHCLEIGNRIGGYFCFLANEVRKTTNGGTWQNGSMDLFLNTSVSSCPQALWQFH